MLSIANKPHRFCFHTPKLVDNPLLPWNLANRPNHRRLMEPQPSFDQISAPHPSSSIYFLHINYPLVNIQKASNSYWTWPLKYIGDLPIKNCDFPSILYVYQRVTQKSRWNVMKHWFDHVFPSWSYQETPSPTMCPMIFRGWSPMVDIWGVPDMGISQ